MINIDSLAKKIWNYHLLHQKLTPADVIILLGSNDLRVANRAAELFATGYAPLIVVSGNRGKLTKSWKKSEAETFKEKLLSLGIPNEKILIEPRATNTSENIQYSQQLLASKGIIPKEIIAVQKPYMERRTYATFRKIWPKANIKVTSPDISYEEYFTPELTKEEVISTMVGDLQRIKVYADRGFQIPQETPEEIWAAFEVLVTMGYTSHLVSD